MGHRHQLDCPAIVPNIFSHLNRQTIGAQFEKAVAEMIHRHSSEQN